MTTLSIENTESEGMLQKDAPSLKQEVTVYTLSQLGDQQQLFGWYPITPTIPLVVSNLQNVEGTKLLLEQLVLCELTI